MASENQLVRAVASAVRTRKPQGVRTSGAFPYPGPVNIDTGHLERGMVEKLSEAAHEAWMETKAEQGVHSRRSEWGEELMVPYRDLSERAKDLDRGTVRGVLAAIERAGYAVSMA